MSEATAWRLTTAVLFTIAATIGAVFVGPIAVEIVLVIWLFWLTCTAAAREELRVLRRRTMHALATLRRRHDNELLEVWTEVYGKPAAEYAPEPAWQPVELEQPDVFEPDPEPTTAPIQMPEPLGPATVPDMKQASKVAPLPSGIADDWEQARDRILAEADADIARVAALAKIGTEAA